MIYFVDYENVGDSIFQQAHAITNQDTLVLFFNQNNCKLSFASHVILENLQAKKEYMPIKVGTKNALDFQLVTYLGHQIATSPEESYCIISKDNGFDVVCAFWNEKGAILTRKPTFAKASEPKKKSELHHAVAPFQEEAKTILAIVEKHKTKQSINNALVKSFGSEKAGKMYKAIKSCLPAKK